MEKALAKKAASWRPLAGRWTGAPLAGVLAPPLADQAPTPLRRVSVWGVADSMILRNGGWAVRGGRAFLVLLGGIRAAL